MTVCGSPAATALRVHAWPLAMRVTARIGRGRARDRGVVEGAGNPGHAVPRQALREDPRHLRRGLRSGFEPAGPPSPRRMRLVGCGPASARRYPYGGRPPR